MPHKAKPPVARNTNAPEDTKIEVFPSKSLFVDMLTRDIDLADAILDLLDNCVDGVRRLKRRSTPDTGAHDGSHVNLPRDYRGYWARIEYNAEKFVIEDNCGGISLHDAVEYAFKFGKPAEFSSPTDGTIGLVGIGMKRALLKMGKSSIVHSYHSEDTFQVRIIPSWLIDDTTWTLHYERVAPLLPDNGTRIEVTELSEDVRSQFQETFFYKKLWEKIEGAFSILIARGFKVTINGKEVGSETLQLLWQEEIKDGRSVRPFVYRENINGVEVYLTVGFRQMDKESSEEDDSQRFYRSTASGWTVACNDRVVLYRDKSEQTGWGTDNVPEYHTQFIAVSGFAEFRSDDPRRLPFTTTKYGINQQSNVYIRAFDIMREGTRIFTDWTYKFKQHNKQRDEIFATAVPRSVERIKEASPIPAPRLDGTRPALRTKPSLPQPKVERTEQTVVFKRLTSEIRKIGVFLRNDPEMPASQVGNECFERVLRDATKR